MECLEREREKSSEESLHGKHEEEDSVVRSVKKSKGEGIEDANMDDEMHEKGATAMENAKANISARKTVLYRDKLLHLNGNDHNSDSEDENWMVTQQREEEEEEDGMDEIAGEGDVNLLCPAYSILKSRHKQDCEQWKRALIIKLLGRRISSKFLLARLQRLWGLTGTYEVVDLDNGHLLLRFTDEKDYLHVLQHGPWVVADHYLVVQRWRPRFNPYEEDVKKLAIWLRIPGLPIELYSSHHLWRIGNLFGRTLKVD